MDLFQRPPSMMLMSCEMGKLFEWDKWTTQIPKLKFKPDWEVQVIPPMVGAVVRFCVYKNGKRVSVYLDCYDNLGCFGAPHWEIYPDTEDSNARFAMNDTDDLINAIDESLNKP